MQSLRSHFTPLLAGLSLLGMVLTPLAPVRADLVTDWNAEALTAMSSGTEAPFVARDLAMLNVAIYNAGESLRSGYNTYGFNGYTAPTSGPTGASIEAAMATAANTVMQSLYGGSSAAFTSLYDTQMSGVALGQARDDGIAWGLSIANDILAWRSADGSGVAASTPYSPVGTVGYWNQTSPAAALLPGWGNVDTFSIGSTAGYTSSLPGPLRTDYLATSQYAADYNQVKELGAQFSLTRTADQTNQAYFWAGGEGTVKVPGMWNEIAATAAATAGLNVFDTARLFAAMNVAMADAGIAAFAQAYDVQFWRPETAIANGGDGFFDNDGNINTEGDIFWLPLITSPSFPEYASAQAAYSAAAAAVLAEYLGDSQSFSLGSDIDGNGSIDLTRFFNSFSQAAAEAAQSGIYAGTQFGTSVTDAQALGENVANQVVSNNFALVPEPAGALLVLLGCAMGLLDRRRTLP
ncbi:MAG TPA: vanadium-dependent haloperoxidase [Prosthecobacter sp.]